VEAGEIIRFAYQVLDADKAKMLNDKKLEPSLIDPQAGVRLVVPAWSRWNSAPEWLARGGQDLLDGVLQQRPAGSSGRPG